MQFADVAILAGLTVPKWAELIVLFRIEIFFLIESFLPLVIAAVPLCSAHGGLIFYADATHGGY